MLIASLLNVLTRKQRTKWDIGGFYGKITTNVFAMPGVLFGLCILLYFNQRRTIGAVIAAGGSDESAYRTASVAFKQNIFFSIFLLCTCSGTALHDDVYPWTDMLCLISGHHRSDDHNHPVPHTPVPRLRRRLLSLG